jgi:hypothetical protein
MPPTFTVVVATCLGVVGFGFESNAGFFEATFKYGGAIRDGPAAVPASSLPGSVMGTFNSADFVIVGQPVSKYYVP